MKISLPKRPQLPSKQQHEALSEHKAHVKPDLLLRIEYEDGSTVARAVHKVVLLGQSPSMEWLKQRAQDESLELDMINISPSTNEQELDAIIERAYAQDDHVEKWGFDDLYASKRFHDVAIRVKATTPNEEKLEEFPAHKLILMCRVPYFRALFTSPWADSDGVLIKMEETCVYPDTLPYILHIYESADFLGMLSLCAYLISHMYNIVHDADIPRFARWSRTLSLEDVELDCLSTIANNFEDVCKWKNNTFFTSVHPQDVQIREKLVQYIVDDVVSVKTCVQHLGMSVRIVKSNIISGKSQREAMIIRDACKAIENRSRDVIVHNFDAVSEDVYLTRLLDRAAFGAEYVEETLKCVTENLNEESIISHINTVQKLRQRAVNGYGRADVRDMLEEALEKCVVFASRRWISLRQKGSFWHLDLECVERIAQGAFVSSETLLADDAQTKPRNASNHELGAETRTRLRPVLLERDKVTPPPPRQHSSSPTQASPNKTSKETAVSSGSRVKVLSKSKFGKEIVGVKK
ncbi:hypothetical protein SeLEV6574_g06750 [Synchytrium endobioticum]|uniref:BTB domain-containing protein n=1 Tax=Synchytrium endobioticum TaxID=286115 RepID=A0A507CK65_9FUNG|nr:hypothetical protein SeLEV6574_g06750 [Synchytrium endobioticum]